MGALYQPGRCRDRSRRDRMSGAGSAARPGAAMFSSQISLYNLVTLCQAFKVGLSAGLPLVDVFEQQGRKGPYAARSVVSKIADRLRAGDALEDVLRAYSGSF